MFQFFSIASLVGIPIGIASSAIELEISALAAGIKRYNSIIKKKRNKTWKSNIVSKN